MKKNVIVIGDNCIDINIKIKDKNFNLSYDSNHHMEKLKIKPGGTGVNFSLAISKLGKNVYYFGSISRDSFGKKILNHLKKYKVNLDLVNFSNKKTALIVIVINKNGERISFANLKKASYLDLNFDLINKININDIDAFYISGGILTEKNFNQKIIDFLDKIGSKNKIFFDFNYRIGKGIRFFKKFAYEVFKRSFIIFTNEEEFKIIGKYRINELIKNGKIFIVKMGEKGAKLLNKNEEIFVEGYKVKSVDTVGAGDIFNAAFLSNYLDTLDLKRSLNFANYVAAVSTTKFGFYIPVNKINKKF